jgi:hypothetical protein
LYDYHARYYDPLIGRFVSADSIVPGAGNPQALNRYAYTFNNPVKYTDPTGHRVSCGDDVDGGCGGDDFTPPINGTSVTYKQGQAIYERAKQNPELLKYESVRFAARTYAENVAHEPLVGPTEDRDTCHCTVNLGYGASLNIPMSAYPGVGYYGSVSAQLAFDDRGVDLQVTGAWGGGIGWGFGAGPFIAQTQYPNAEDQQALGKITGASVSLPFVGVGYDDLKNSNGEHVGHQITLITRPLGWVAEYHPTVDTATFSMRQFVWNVMQGKFW